MSRVCCYVPGCWGCSKWLISKPVPLVPTNEAFVGDTKRLINPFLGAREAVIAELLCLNPRTLELVFVDFCLVCVFITPLCAVSCDFFFFLA